MKEVDNQVLDEYERKIKKKLEVKTQKSTIVAHESMSSDGVWVSIAKPGESYLGDTPAVLVEYNEELEAHVAYIFNREDLDYSQKILMDFN